MKAGGTRPTTPKKFLFSIKHLCTQQANILDCGHRRRRTHKTRLKQRQQSTSGAQHKHVRTPRELTLYYNNNNNNNSIYLRANLTAQRPITKRARIEKKKITYKQNTKAKQ
jgi:hypothetical protein